ncbi:MAG: tetratricopeptide repeat protein [bacterium]
MSEETENPKDEFSESEISEPEQVEEIDNIDGDFVNDDIASFVEPPEINAPEIAHRIETKAIFPFIPVITSLAIVIVIAVIGTVWVNVGRAGSTEVAKRIAYGKAFIIDGDLDSALYQFTRALEIHPGNPEAHSELGKIALAQGRGEEAARHFLAVLEKKPNDRLGHLAMGCLYAIATVSSDDPRGLRPYLLTKFTDVIPVAWSPDLTFTAPEGEDPLSQAIYQFQFAGDIHNREDQNIAASKIGLVLTHIANYDLANARQKLSRLSAETTDDTVMLTINGILNDINWEEQRQRLLAKAENQPAETPAQATPQTEAPPVTDYSQDLSPLPPIAETNMSPEQLRSGGFGSHAFDELQSGGNDFSMKITQQDIFPQPSVKPITNDIWLPDSNKVVHTVRLANITLPGSVGFREGETIVMPNSNVEVKVLESGDEKIVLQEGANIFTWVPGDVGWKLKEDNPPPAEEGTENPPAQSENDDQSTVDGSGKLGPEIPSGSG